MPTYEYQCKKCGHAFEVIQSIKAEPLKTCPKAECPQDSGRGKVMRLIGTGGGLLFKGSGFYITDYRSEGYKSAAKADKDSSSGSDSSSKSESSTKSDSSKSESTSKSSNSTKD